MFGRKKKDSGETTYKGGKNKTPSEITATTVDDNSSEESEVTVPPITWKEIKHLKRAKYDTIKDNFKTAYVLLNKKTGQIVEVNAASSFHACNIIGWKSKKVKVLETKDLTKGQGVPETQERVDERTEAKA